MQLELFRIQETTMKIKYKKKKNELNKIKNIFLRKLNILNDIKGEPELTDRINCLARIQYYHKNVLRLNISSFNFIAFLFLHLLIN